MAAAAPLPPSTSRAGAKGKLKRGASDLIDPLFYNQLLNELRQHQDAGTAYFGSFVYEPRNVPASLLLPSGSPIFQLEDQTLSSQPGKNATVFDRVASAKIDKDSAVVKLLTEPPESVRSRVASQSPAGRSLQRAGSGFKSPPVTGKPSDLKPAVEAVTFIEKAKAHYGGEFYCGDWQAVTDDFSKQVESSSIPCGLSSRRLGSVNTVILGSTYFSSGTKSTEADTHSKRTSRAPSQYLSVFVLLRLQRGRVEGAAVRAADPARCAVGARGPAEHALLGGGGHAGACGPLHPRQLLDGRCQVPAGTVRGGGHCGHPLPSKSATALLVL